MLTTNERREIIAERQTHELKKLVITAFAWICAALIVGCVVLGIMTRSQMHEETMEKLHHLPMYTR